jgi:hypothetical protein
METVIGIFYPVYLSTRALMSCNGVELMGKVYRLRSVNKEKASPV